jgi:GTP-binding protein
VLFADIPGLIEGAAKGKGLGHDFLRHIERTAVILHLIDAYTADVAATYRTVKNELAAYQPDLAERPEIVALTKVEGLDSEIIDDLTSQLMRAVPKKTPIFAISSQAGTGLQQLLFTIKDIVKEVRAKPLAEAEKPDMPVLTMTDTSDAWQVKKTGDIFVVTGPRIEQFAKRTDFDNEQGVQRLRDIMRRAGILHELRRQGVAPGDTITVGKNTQDRFSY